MGCRGVGGKLSRPADSVGGGWGAQSLLQGGTLGKGPRLAVTIPLTGRIVIGIGWAVGLQMGLPAPGFVRGWAWVH